MRVFRGLDELPEISDSVITIGSFDGVHTGHQKILDRVKQLSSEIGSENYVLTFDPHPRSIIYPRDNSLELLSSLEEKIELFRSFGIDNLVIVPFTIEFSQISAYEYIDKFLVGKFNPKYLVIGYDHRFGINRTGDIGLLKQLRNTYNYQIVEIAAQEIDEMTISSTKIRRSLKSGDLDQAISLLGRPYDLSGKIIRGRKLGTEIGFPTANLKVEDSKKLIPMDGIYACQVTVENKNYNGMLYIGDIPTIGIDTNKSIEVNIFDFNDDIYDKRVNIKILHFLRHDRKFNNLDELKAQLHIDREDSLNFFKNYTERSTSRVAIAILNYNTQQLLEDFLPSVSYSSDDDIDIVLIDNASTDGSVEYVNKWFPEVKLIEYTNNYGYAEGYNRAIDKLNSEYIVLLNSDVQVEVNWLDPIINFLDENKDYAAAMPKILSFEEKESFEYAGACGGYIDFLAYPFCRGRVFNHLENDEGQYDDIQSIFWASGAALVIRRSIYQNFGGLDKDYFAHQEEIDLSWRLHNAGYKLAVIPESIVYHLGGGTLNYNNEKKIFLNFRNNMFTLFKNDTAFNLLWKLPVRLVLDGIAAIRFLAIAKPKGFTAIFKAHMAFYANFFKLISKRWANKKILKQNSIGSKNKDGWLRSSIVFKYFISGKKKYSDII